MECLQCRTIGTVREREANCVSADRSAAWLDVGLWFNHSHLVGHPLILSHHTQLAGIR